MVTSVPWQLDSTAPVTGEGGGSPARPMAAESKAPDDPNPAPATPVGSA
jgi:hypothetical protein